jgi:hypothetical protein
MQPQGTPPLSREEQVGLHPREDGEPPEGCSLLAALPAEAAPLLQRGLSVLLRDEDARIRLAADDLPLDSASKERRDMIEAFVARHPGAELHIASSWSPNVVAIAAYDDEHIRTVRDVLRDESIIAPTAMSRCHVGQVWFFAMPAGQAVLDEVHIDGGFLCLEGINESAPVFGGPLQFSWDEPIVDPSALPELPAGLVAVFSGHFVAVDGQPRFREFGRAGNSYRWWGLATMLESARPGQPWDDDFTATLCHCVAPDPNAAHVCNLVLERDFKGDDALKQSLDTARGFIRRLREHAVPDSMIRPRWTGNKSIHLEVGYRCFGQVPRTDGNNVMGHLAERLFADVAEFDRSLFHRRQMARVLGTRHSSTGRYCIPLTVDDLFSLTVDELIERAKRPPTWKPAPASADKPVPTLVTIWRETADAMDEPARASEAGRRSQGTRKSAASKGRTGKHASADSRVARRILRAMPDSPACIKALLAGQRTEQGHRNNVTVALAAYLHTLRSDELSARRLFRDASGSIASRSLDRAGVERQLLDALQTAGNAKNDGVLRTELRRPARRWAAVRVRLRHAGAVDTVRHTSIPPPARAGAARRRCT